MTTPASGQFSTTRKNLVLAAMVLAVSMTLVDQTVVAVAAPRIQSDLGLTAAGAQWIIGGYLLALAAFFVVGGRLADTIGHKPILLVGVAVFIGASVMCGVAPDREFAEEWLIGWRVVQGAGAALLFPSALAIVVSTFDLHDRGRALAVFFGFATGLTAAGPIIGGYLAEWTWRAVFWINVPVALLALALVAVSRPSSTRTSAPFDWRGALIVAAGVGLSVFGVQQAGRWGWTDAGTDVCIAAGAALLVGFYFYERGLAAPLVDVRMFSVRPFLVQNLVLLVAMTAFVPVFFFASVYAQVTLDMSASKAGEFLLHYFIGFVIAAQIGGAMLDRSGAKTPVVWGCAIAAVGYYLWAGSVTTLSYEGQHLSVVLAGAGVGLMLGPANTDAINRASRLSYGEATGITQTVRYYSAVLGIAVLGTVLLGRLTERLTDSLVARGVSPERAPDEARAIARTAGGAGDSDYSAALPDFVRLDFAYATQTVLYAMAGAMLLAGLIAAVGLRSGRQEETSPAFAEEPRGRQPGLDPAVEQGER